MKFVVIDLGNGCRISAGYVERESCDGKTDYQLTGHYEWSSGACQQVQGILLQDGAEAARVLRLIHTTVMEQLITRHFQDLPHKPICGSRTDLSYRLTTGSCSLKHSLSDNGASVTYLTERCGTNCCIRTYTACLDDTAIVISEITPLGAGEGTCPYSTADPTRRCHQICYDE